MNWTWLMIAFLFDSCFAVPTLDAGDGINIVYVHECIPEMLYIFMIKILDFYIVLCFLTGKSMQKHEEPCYLRAQLQQCSDSIHLDVIIDTIVRYTKRLSNERFLCLPVSCDESRSMIVGTVTVEDDAGLTEPKDGFSGDVVGLFSEESECQTGADFVVITCPHETNGLCCNSYI